MKTGLLIHCINTETRFYRVSEKSQYTLFVVGRDSSVGIATRYGLGGPGMESQLRRVFSHPSRPALKPILLPKQWVPGLSEGKEAGTWDRPPTPSNAEVKERGGTLLFL